MAESDESLRPIVVGTDLAPAALAAAEWGAERAELLGAPLTLVMVAPGLPIPTRTSVYKAMHSPDYLVEVRERVSRRLDEEAERVRQKFPGVAVDTFVSEGDAAGVLVELSRTALVTVIGTHGKPDLVEAFLGSTAEGVIMNAYGTVVAVPPDAYDRAAPVVAGVDNAAAEDPVLRAAHTEANVMKRPLVILHAWQEMVFATPFDMPVMLSDPLSIDGELRSLIEESLERYRGEFPDVQAELEVVQGYPREALVDRSRTASALVVGARGKGGFLGLLLGSTSRHVVRHSHCPVIVVRPRPS